MIISIKLFYIKYDENSLRIWVLAYRLFLDCCSVFEKREHWHFGITALRELEQIYHVKLKKLMCGKKFTQNLNVLNLYFLSSAKQLFNLLRQLLAFQLFASFVA